MKVLVVGGSISGLFTTEFLLKYGIETTLIEKKRNIGDEIICAGGISSYMIKEAGISVPMDFVASKVSKVNFFGPSLCEASLDLKGAFGIILKRDEWERWMGERVRDMGAKVMLRCKDVLPGFDYVVGCDGISGVTRRAIGIPPPSVNDIHLTVQSVCRCRQIEDDAISIFLGSQVAEKGYGWAFPIGGSEFRVGLGVPLSRSKRIFSLFDRLTSIIRAKPLERPRCKLVPTAHPMESVSFGRFALVGDAALQTDPFTGGGIANAIIGADMVSRAISKSCLKEYDELHRKRIYKRNRVRYELKRMLYEMSDEELDDVVEALRGFRIISDSLGMALAQLVVELMIKKPKIILKHRAIRRLLSKAF